MTVFDIRPYEGVGPLVLGMSPDEVHGVLGAPVRSATSEGARNETYPHLSIAYSAGKEQLIELGFGSRLDVSFQGESLFTAANSVELLSAADGAPLEGLGFLVFLNLGIALADFDSDQENDRAVQVFQRGRWDSIKSLKPYVPAK